MSSETAVKIMPGVTAFDRTPDGPHSIASGRKRIWTPALAFEQVPVFGVVFKTFSDRVETNSACQGRRKYSGWDVDDE